MAAAPGGGCYEVASDGGIFAFGPGAVFYGSTGCLGVAGPITAIVISHDVSVVGTGTACDPTFRQALGGYGLVAADGGVFAFGNSRFAGSLGGQGVSGIVGIANS